MDAVVVTSPVTASTDVTETPAPANVLISPTARQSQAPGPAAPSWGHKAQQDTSVRVQGLRSPCGFHRFSFFTADLSQSSLQNAQSMA